ncbi:RagB/SusD family nutrient uptake outer membrane protein [Pseudoflavitalea sp. G-6-1-2]|uniref:RagB/SusD family nutrient uptake outer membrane protein n=1 Tax=Pseudoflavitalea sp. G-6-1-2 TaxID=2728841 RepID=UPI00146B6A47|nr:RagB/SusD family nutrient uptake outer membrane protein [Pseudoflavitalea sp. G-6-1-2]NML22235.1 RagB/SusD family nutrient uptake outer membrane protein [Pseudoflavitalea sp. G-6-1-2]
MKCKKISTYLWLLPVVLALASCKKSYLEVSPKGKLIAGAVADYDLLINNLDLMNISATSQVLMGDEMAAVDPHFSGADPGTQRRFRWEKDIYEINEDAAEMQPMKSIYLYNKIITELPAATGGPEALRTKVMAEAKAMRAWTYFLLINYYGKPYSAQAASDPGFPIVTDARVTDTKYTRASVQAVYDMIVKDLNDAIPDLPVKTAHRLRMSRGAAEGLLGKVYVFMGKFSEALPLLTSALSRMAEAEIPVKLIDYNAGFAPGGIFLPINLFGPSFPLNTSNEENVFVRQFSNNWSFINSEMVITDAMADLYAPSDLRLRFFSNMPFPSGAAYPGKMLRRMGPIGVQTGVVVPELYLLSAECKARLDDLQGAVTDCEQLRKKRMPVADAPVPPTVAADKISLVKFILEERLREFSCMGYRWFDMRRLSVDASFSNTVGYTHTLFQADGSTKQYTLRPERMVHRFPQKLMDQNPGMENNP